MNNYDFDLLKLRLEMRAEIEKLSPEHRDVILLALECFETDSRPSVADIQSQTGLCYSAAHERSGRALTVFGEACLKNKVIREALEERDLKLELPKCLLFAKLLRPSKQAQGPKAKLERSS